MTRSASASEIGPVCTTSASRGVMRSATSAFRGHEPHVALGQQTRQPPIRVDDGQRPDAGPLHQTDGVGERPPFVDRVGIRDDAVLRALDGGDLGDLRLDVAGPESAIDHADAALFREHDRHRRSGDRVHVGRHDRALEGEVLAKSGR